MPATTNGTLTAITSNYERRQRNLTQWKYVSTGQVASDALWPNGTNNLLPIILGGGHAIIGGTGTVYLMLFDLTAVPADGAVASGQDWIIGPIYSPSAFSFNGNEWPMAVGLSWCLSSTFPSKTVTGAVVHLGLTFSF